MLHLSSFKSFILAEIIESYKARIKSIQKDVSDIMKEEAEEREVFSSS